MGFDGDFCCIGESVEVCYFFECGLVDVDMFGVVVLESKVVGNVDLFYVSYGFDGDVCSIGESVKVGNFIVCGVVDVDVFVSVIFEYICRIEDVNIESFWVFDSFNGNFCCVGKGCVVFCKLNFG